MVLDFEFAEREFGRQTKILEKLIDAVNFLGAGRSDELLGVSTLTPIEIPDGGQNTMAAAAIVLLASHFEEYVRQQIQEYSKGLIAHYVYLRQETRDSFVDSYWRSGVSRLSNIRPKGLVAWSATAEPLLRKLVEYPVSGNLVEFQPEYICTHENNMRWDTVTDLSSRVGVRSLSDMMFKSKTLKGLLGNPRKGDFAVALRRKMNSFFELRNRIIHSISQDVGVGSTIFSEWAEFFRIFASAFSASLLESFDSFEREIDQEKRRATVST